MNLMSTDQEQALNPKGMILNMHTYILTDSKVKRITFRPSAFVRLQLLDSCCHLFLLVPGTLPSASRWME